MFSKEDSGNPWAEAARIVAHKLLEGKGGKVSAKNLRDLVEILQTDLEVTETAEKAALKNTKPKKRD